MGGPGPAACPSRGVLGGAGELRAPLPGGVGAVPPGDRGGSGRSLVLVGRAVRGVPAGSGCTGQVSPGREGRPRWGTVSIA